MVAASPSAATAPEVTTYQQIGVSNGSELVARGATLANDPVVHFDGQDSTEQWFRIRLGNGALIWNVTVGYTGASGPTGSYELHLYTSDNPAEDGSGLTETGTSMWASLDYYSVTLGRAGVGYWLYVRLVPDPGTGVAETFTVSTTLRDTVLVTETTNGQGGGWIAAGSTSVAIFGPQPVRGKTAVTVVAGLATDDLVNAPDLSHGGAVDTGSGWWGAGTAGAGETPISTGTGLTWSRVSWHKLYAGAGTLTLHDDDTLASHVSPGAPVSYNGTVVQAFTGPADATYADLTSLGPAALVQNAAGTDFIGALYSVDVPADSWVYIAHSCVFMADQLGTADASGVQLQSMAWSAAPAGPPPPPPAQPVATAAGTTRVTAQGVSQLGPGLGVPDTAAGSTDVTAAGRVHPIGTPDLVVGSTVVRAAVSPDLSGNPPIDLALTLHGQYTLIPPTIAQLPELHTARAMAAVSLTMPTPVIVAGKPVVPAHLGRMAITGTLIVGDKHIHAIPDPNPIWDPRTGGWATPPPPATPDWSGRWVVDDLPSPGSGYYWLGDPTWADGTANIGPGARQWAPHASTPHAPAWRSFFPYKPSVRAVDHYLPGGTVVHHPKGVHFNPHFIEHMWLDFGGARRQPFTWVIAGMVASYPTRTYTHHILDAGRNPDAVHFPRLGVNDVWVDRRINDGLNYRTVLAYSPQRQDMFTRPGPSVAAGKSVRAHVDANIRPKMFFGVYNGGQSLTGAWGTGSQRGAHGTVDNGPAQAHRFYVLGREQGWISQDHASHLLIFEIRYWHSALTHDQLERQYAQLSSTYHFDRYRSL